MAEIITDIREFVQLTRQYLDVKVDIARSQAKITLSDIISTLIIGLSVASMVVGALVVLSFGLAHTIGNKLGDTALGFYIVGAGYLVISILLFVLGKAFLKKKIQDGIIRNLDKNL